MRLVSLLAPAACGVLVLTTASDANAQSSERRSGWYVGGGVGANWVADIEQNGENRDRFCYPTNACFDEYPRPSLPGYRWVYDLESAAGPLFELSTGFILNRARLEVSFVQRTNDVAQMFRHASTLDGAALPPRPDSTVVADTRSSVDDLAVRTLAFNAYYHFRSAATGLSPYVGGGGGPAVVDIRGEQFSDSYYDTAADGVYYPPLSFYNSRLNADFSDTVLAGHLHAGADYGLSARAALGVKLTYTMLGDVEYTGPYDAHAMNAVDPDFTHTDTFTGARYWSLLFTVRYTLGGG